MFLNFFKLIIIKSWYMEEVLKSFFGVVQLVTG